MSRCGLLTGGGIQGQRGMWMDGKTRASFPYELGLLKPVSNGMNKIHLQARLFSRNSCEYGFLANGGESNGLAESSLG